MAWKGSGQWLKSLGLYTHVGKSEGLSSWKGTWGNMAIKCNVICWMGSWNVMKIHEFSLSVDGVSKQSILLVNIYKRQILGSNTILWLNKLELFEGETGVGEIKMKQTSLIERLQVFNAAPTCSSRAQGSSLNVDMPGDLLLRNERMQRDKWSFPVGKSEYTALARC